MDGLSEIVQTLSVAITAAVIGLSAISVSIIKYLTSARIKNVAKSISTGLSDQKLREETESRLQAMLLKLLKDGEGFVERYEEASGLRRKIFILGSMFSAFSIVILILFVFASSIIPQIKELGVDSVLSYQASAMALFEDISSNFIIISLICMGGAVFYGLFLYIFERLSIVIKIHKGEKNIEDPSEINKYDIAIGAIAVIFPFSITFYFLSSIYYAGIYDGYIRESTSRYEDLLKIQSYSQDSVLKTLGVPLKEQEKKYLRKLLVGAIVYVYINHQDNNVDEQKKTSTNINKALQAIDKKAYESFINQEYFSNNQKIKYLRNLNSSPLDLFKSFTDENDEKDI